MDTFKSIKDRFALRPGIVLLMFAACPFVSVVSADANDSLEYLRDIKPILARKCYACHGALKQEASLRLDTVSLMKRGGPSVPQRSKLVPRPPASMITPTMFWPRQ